MEYSSNFTYHIVFDKNWKVNDAHIAFHISTLLSFNHTFYQENIGTILHIVPNSDAVEWYAFHGHMRLLF